MGTTMYINKPLRTTKIRLHSNWYCEANTNGFQSYGTININNMATSNMIKLINDNN